ncbi:MAG: beta-propeller fold lactonase family protein, partial [Planctomycetota bacterium]|nr:beta-propeller fold lactonase family protein [Planctomycetota bacterium]
SPDGNEVWVGNRDDNTITIVDPHTLEIVHTMPCEKFPIRCKFTPDGKLALVSNAASGDVAIFDVAQRKEIKRLSMEIKAVELDDERLFGDRFGDSPVPVGILIPPDGKHAYVACTNADIVTVIDLETLEICGRIVAGKEPDGLGWSPWEYE